MKMETDKPIGLVLSELIFKNLFWFLIFSAIYAKDENPDPKICIVFGMYM